MYMKLLEETIRELKGEDLEDERRAAVNLRIDLRIDESYIPDMNQRLTVYRRLASARGARGGRSACSRNCATAMARRQRPSVNLAQYARIRLMADRIGLESLDREGADRRLKVQAGREDRPGAAPETDPRAGAT